MGKPLDIETLNFSIGLLAKSIDMTFIKKKSLFNIIQKEEYRKATADDDPSVILTVVSNDTKVLSNNQIKSDNVRFVTPIKSIFEVGSKIVRIDEILEPKFHNVKCISKEELNIYKNASVEDRQSILSTNTLLIINSDSMIIYDYELDNFNEILIGVSNDSGIKEWKQSTNYSEDDIVISNKTIYISKDNHTSSDSFENDKSHWENPLLGTNVKIKVNDTEIEKDVDGFIKITIPKNISDLQDSEFTNIKDKDVIVWDTLRNKFINKAIELSDEKIKLYAADVESKYLSELIGSSLNIVDGKLEAVSLKGMTVTIANLNTLAGMDSNIKDILDSISSGMNFMGTVDTYAKLLAIENPINGDVRIVKKDESRENSSFTYVYNESQKQWQPIGACEIKVRDFTVNPIDLTKEVKGILPQKNMDLKNILKTTDIIDKVDSNSTSQPASANSVSIVNKALSELKNKVDKGITITSGTNIDVKKNEDGSFIISYKGEESSDNSSNNLIYIYDDESLPQRIENDLTCLVLTRSGKMYTTKEDGTLEELPSGSNVMTSEDCIDVISAILNDTVIEENALALVTKNIVTEIMKSLNNNTMLYIDQKVKKMSDESRNLIISKIKEIINKK